MTCLPATLARHDVIGTNERRVLQAFGDHTEPVLLAIRSTLGGDLHLQRAALVQQLLNLLENAQVVLAAVDRHPHELASVMQGLTRLQDFDPNTPRYWFLWELIADEVKPAK